MSNKITPRLSTATGDTTGPNEGQNKAMPGTRQGRRFISEQILSRADLIREAALEALAQGEVPQQCRTSQERLDRAVRLRERGWTCERIAQELGCSVRTVKRYTAGIEPTLVRRRRAIGRDELEAWGAHIICEFSKRRAWPQAYLHQVLVAWSEHMKTRHRLYVENMARDTDMQISALREFLSPRDRDYREDEQIKRLWESARIAHHRSW